MAFVGEEVFFTVRLLDKDGNPGDPSTIRAAVLLPDGSTPIQLDYEFPRVLNSGVYNFSWTIEQEGEHWLRVETTGPIHTAIEKRFDGAKRMVTIQ